MTEPKCLLCKLPLTMSIIQRRNKSYTGVCNNCKFNYAITFDNNDYNVINVQQRFSHNGTKWHLTYRPQEDETTFVTVEKQPDPVYLYGCRVEQAKIRKEKKLPGFVSAQKFVNLIAFL